MAKEFSKKEIELFEELIKIYKTNPVLALSLLENEEQEKKFDEYYKSKVDDKKIIEGYIDELGDDSDE